MTAYTDFRSDPNRRDVWLLEMLARNVETDVISTLRFSSERYGTSSTDLLANFRFDALIVRGLERTGGLSGGRGPVTGLLPPRTGGSIVLGQRFGNLDMGTLTQLGGYSIRDYSFGGRAVTVKHGGYSPKLGRWLTYAEFKVVLEGTIEGNPLIDADTVTFRLATKDRNFEHPVQDRKFLGLGYALSFDGSNDAIDFGTSATFNFTSGAFSVEFPILVEANPGAEKKLISRGSDSTDGWSVVLSTAGLVGLRTNQSGASQTTTSDPIPLGKWVWVSITRSGAVVKIYFDGLDVTDSAATHVNPTTASRNLYACRSDNGAVFAQCLLGELRIWDVARTKAQVNQTVNRTLDSSEVDASVVLYARLDEGTLTTAADSSATNADGTIAGATWVHSGTGHIEHQGQPLPDVWGPVKGFSPILIDEPRRIYQVSGDPIDGFDRVDVGGLQNMIAENALTDLTTFLTSTTANGKYDTCISEQGTFLRLGSNPSKPLTVDVTGNAPGGTYLETAAEQVRYIVCNRGQNRLTDPTDLDTTSFSDLDTANSSPVGHAWTSEASVAEVVGFALSSIGAVGYFDRDAGQFFVEQFTGVPSRTSVMTLTHRDVANGSLEVLDRSVPISSVTIYYQRNYTVLGSGDLLPGVAGTDRERFVKQEWRSAQVNSPVTKADYKDAQALELDSGIDATSDARVEAIRLAALYDTPDQAFRFLCRSRAFDLDFMDCVVFHYQDFDRYNVLQSRFGTSDTSKFIVIDVSDDIGAGGSWLTLWREEVA